MTGAQALTEAGDRAWNEGRRDDALAHYRAALDVSAHHAPAHYGVSLVCWAQGDRAAAVAALDAAIAAQPGYAEAWFNRGVMLHALWRLDEASASYARAVQLAPGLTQGWNNYAGVLMALGRDGEALSCVNRAIALTPNNPAALYNRGTLQARANRHDEAIADFERTLVLAPEHPDAFGSLISSAMRLCDFDRMDRLLPALRQRVTEGRGIIPTLMLLGAVDDPALQRRGAENFVRATIRSHPEPLWRGERYNHPRIRLAYLSADLQDHPVACLAAGLFAAHDRSRFEVHGYSYGRDDGSAMRMRLRQSFDYFHDVRQVGDEEVARRLRADEIDIAIDLTGHTQHARPEILKYRPAPVQAQFLGYPGTMGCDFLDVIIADGIVIPPGADKFYTEKVVRLPFAYQVNDSARARPSPTPRVALGLPEDAFVFCCFNNSWKITQAMFALWMRLLTAVPGSLLWLLHDNDGASRNLRNAARAHGVDPARLVFAPRVELSLHLARQGAADLVLDTLPYNAHTTASDALWMGVPVVTCRGESFAARVAASLLTEAGLGELITTSLGAYETLALSLARDPAKLAALRARLATPSPLFDTARFTAGLEAAFIRLLAG